MSKARLIATSGICGAVAVICMMLSSIAIWATLILSVVASIAVVIPLLIDPKGLVYSLLVYAVAGVLGAFLGFTIGNVVYVAPMVAFCMPFAIVKVYGESVKVSARFEEGETLEDPFEAGQNTQVVAVQLKGKKRLHPVVKWILYYVLLEVGVGLTMLAAYLLTRPLFDEMVQNKYFFLLLAATQLIVPPFDLLMRGCLIGTTKLLHKVVK